MFKKIIALSFLFSIYSYTYAIDFSVLPSREVSCPDANIDAIIYIPNGQSSFSTRISDTFWHPQDRYIANAGTLAKLWMSDNALVSGCNASSDWQKVSDIAPGNNESVVAISSMCTFNKPNNISNKTLQFVFNIRHGEIGGGTSSVTRYYYPETGWYNSPATRLSKSYSNYFVSNYAILGNECLNVTLAWCGDGIPSPTNGEQCDLGAQNGQAGSACSATCQTVTANPYSACVPGNPTADCATNTYPTQAACLLANPGASGRTCYLNNIPACNATRAAQCPVLPACVPGTTTGPQAAPLTATSAGLCPAGQTVGGFTATTVGTITTYNWSCNGSAVGGACAATYDSASAGPACSSLSANPLTGTPPLTVSFIGTGVNLGATSSYRIIITNSLGTVLTTLPNSSGSYIFNNTGTYTAQMFIDTSTGGVLYTGLTSPACTLTNAISVLSACVPGTTTGPQAAPLTATSAGLCPAGQVVGGFTATTVGTLTTYNWSCNGSAVGGACAATYNSAANPYSACTPGNPAADCSTRTYADNAACLLANPVGSGRTCYLNNVVACNATRAAQCPGTGGASNVGKKCVNGVATCASYNTLVACTADGIPASLCYPADSVGLNMCQAQFLSCSGPGGCTNPNGCGPYTGGRCGDGVLQTGEECDVVGAPWCNACKIDMTTNPGANPITDLWMTIPVLDKTKHLGMTWLDAPIGGFGKIPFNDYRMVLGVGTKAFTLADSVGFGIKTKWRIPLIIEADKKICLKSEGASMNSESICTSFGNGAIVSNPRVETWTRVDGTRFVNIGAGDYQIVNPVPRPTRPSPLPMNHTPQQQAEYDRLLQEYYDWTPYILQRSSSPNNITLFKGATPYSRQGQTNIGPTLNSAFFGMAIGNDGKIGLITDTGVDLVKLSVRVSSAAVSSIGSSANRSLQSFINPGNLFASFMTSTSGNTSTTSNNTTGTTNVTLPVIVGGAAGSVSSIADIERYAVNGNRNVLAVNGDLVIENCTAGTFIMSGVRTVIVTGKLIIKCNIGYASDDAVSSWAWITKGGNIEVYNGIGTLSAGAVTNLAGVYVSVQEGSAGGIITYTGNNTTQTILRVEGSMYGNATPLFNSRLYARATGAYDILTTGTILTYSNRALVNPPPLLSQYLGVYQVQRVIQ